MSLPLPSSLFQKVHNRGFAPAAFLNELIEWGRIAPEELFAPNTAYDIYSRIRPELGPWVDVKDRRAAMLEVMRVLAGFESSWDWRDGVDTSRLGNTTDENAEAGAWQTSFDSRKLDASLREALLKKDIFTGIVFQRTTKFDHPFAMDYIARMLRIDTKDPQRLANGPLYKGDERLHIRSSLRGPKESIYPWLSRDAMESFRKLIS